MINQFNIAVIVIIFSTLLPVSSSNNLEIILVEKEIETSNDLLKIQEIDNYINEPLACGDLVYIHSLKFDFYMSMYLLGHPELHDGIKNAYLQSFLTRSATLYENISNQIIDTFNQSDNIVNHMFYWSYAVNFVDTNNFTIYLEDLENIVTSDFLNLCTIYWNEFFEEEYTNYTLIEASNQIQRLNILFNTSIILDYHKTINDELFNLPLFLHGSLFSVAGGASWFLNNNNEPFNSHVLLSLSLEDYGILRLLFHELNHYLINDYTSSSEFLLLSSELMLYDENLSLSYSDYAKTYYIWPGWVEEHIVEAIGRYIVLEMGYEEFSSVKICSDFQEYIVNSLKTDFKKIKNGSIVQFIPQAINSYLDELKNSTSVSTNGFEFTHILLLFSIIIIRKKSKSVRFL